MSTTNSKSSGGGPAHRASLLDADEVAHVLSITPRHVRRRVAERRIPFLKVGRFVRFDPASLNLWLDGQRVEPERGAPRQYGPWR